MIPGETIFANKQIILNTNKKMINLIVTNLGDRPIQVGSHFHFFEVNKNLQFDRKISLGYRLDIPAGTATRFEPGESKNVQLVEFGSYKKVIGFNNLVNDEINQISSIQAINLMHEQGFADLEGKD